MNSEDHEPIIDALLEETLGGIAPPDLSARILQAWSERQAHAGGSSPPLNVYAEVAAPLPPPLVVGSVVRAVHEPLDSSVRSAARRKTKRWSFEIYAVVGAAAVLLIVYVGYQITGQPDRPEIAQPGVNKSNAEPRQMAKAPEAPTKSSPDVVDRDSHLPKVAPSSTNLVDNTPKTPNVAEKSPREVETPVRLAPSDAEVIAFINHELQTRWQAGGVTPSSIAADSEWCRRAFLRIIGRIPTVEELNAFTGDNSSDRHEQLVDRLLNEEPYAEEYARHWSEVWTNVLIGRALGSDPREPASRAGLQEYLHASLRENKPYDRIALELISATGAGQPGADNFNGAANFLLAHATDDATVATARTCRVFLGVQLQCVQCHDHPTAPLSQGTFWAMNAFFRQMKVAGNRNDPRELTDRDFLGYDGRDEEGRVFYELPNGIVKVAEPTFLDGTKLSVPSGRVEDVNRREQLARLVVESKQFGQAAVNRLWSHFLGYGFTRPVDDMVAHAPSHPELLERMSQEFVAHGYDLKQAIRWIALSDAFNRSSKVTDMQLADLPESGTPALFSRYYTRQLPAEEVFRSLQIAAKLRRENADGSIEQARVQWLAQARPVGDEEDAATKPGIIQTNPALVRRATTNNFDTMLHSVSRANLKFDQKVEHLFLAALSRKPTRQELELARTLAGMNGQKEDAALEDIWWALLNSSEFALDH